jgi:hypothetical protein
MIVPWIDLNDFLVASVIGSGPVELIVSLGQDVSKHH